MDFKKKTKYKQQRDAARQEAEQSKQEAEIFKEEARKLTLRAEQIAKQKVTVEREAAKLRQEKEEEEAKAKQKPWRELPPDIEEWDEDGLEDLKISLRQQVKRSKIEGTNVRFLLIGDTGSGKSSLVNSFSAALTGSISQIAISSARDQTTKKYIEYPLCCVDDEADEETSYGGDWMLPFRICDFRGFGTKEHGATDESVIAALKGLIQNEEEIKSGAREADYKSDTSTENTMTYIGVVINATLVGNLGSSSETYQGTTESIRKAITFGIEQDMSTFVFLTNCDLLDGDLSKHPERIYDSKLVGDTVRKAAGKLEINVNQVIPVINFTKEVYVAPEMAFQFLFPLRMFLKDVEEKHRSLQVRKAFTEKTLRRNEFEVIEKTRSNPGMYAYVRACENMTEVVKAMAEKALEELQHIEDYVHIARENLPNNAGLFMVFEECASRKYRAFMFRAKESGKAAKVVLACACITDGHPRLDMRQKNNFLCVPIHCKKEGSGVTLQIDDCDCNKATMERVTEALKAIVMEEESSMSEEPDDTSYVEPRKEERAMSKGPHETSHTEPHPQSLGMMATVTGWLWSLWNMVNRFRG